MFFIDCPLKLFFQEESDTGVKIIRIVSEFLVGSELGGQKMELSMTKVAKTLEERELQVSMFDVLQFFSPQGCLIRHRVRI